jgi:putative photosynthetic complex assembly protein
MSHVHDHRIAKGPVMAATAFVGVALALVAAVPFGLLQRPVPAQELRVAAQVPVVQSRLLRFLDQPDGSVLVRDVQGKEADAVIAAGSNQGFIRGVMRGLARDRKMRGLDDGPPFRLAQWGDGRLSLQDMATGRTIELDAFGDDNRAAFASLLAPVKPLEVAAK